MRHAEICVLQDVGDKAGIVVVCGSWRHHGETVVSWGMRWDVNFLWSLRRPSCRWEMKRPFEMETAISTESCKRVEGQPRSVRVNEVSPSRSMGCTSTLVGTSFTLTLRHGWVDKVVERWKQARVQSVDHGPRPVGTIESRSFDLTEVDWCRRTRWPMGCTPQHGGDESGGAVGPTGAAPRQMC